MSETPAPPVEGPSFEEALQQLERVVQRLEQGDVPLEESLRLYEQGVQLSRLCHSKLEAAEGRVALLLKDGRGEVLLDRQGRPRSAPLDEDGEGGA